MQPLQHSVEDYFLRNMVRSAPINDVMAGRASEDDPPVFRLDPRTLTDRWEVTPDCRSCIPIAIRQPQGTRLHSCVSREFTHSSPPAVLPPVIGQYVCTHSILRGTSSVRCSTFLSKFSLPIEINIACTPLLCLGILLPLVTHHTPSHLSYATHRQYPVDLHQVSFAILGMPLFLIPFVHISKLPYCDWENLIPYLFWE